METLDYDHNLFNAQQQAVDSQLAVRFHKSPIQNEAKSVEEGRPIFDDVDMIEIRVRGSRNDVVNRPVRSDDKRRFSKAWDDYEKGRGQTHEGTPLVEWPLMSASLVEELKYFGFFTVEQLAGASDGVCSKMAGLTNFRERAKLWLQMAKDGAPIAQLQKEKEEMQSQLNAQEQTIKELSAQFTELKAKYETVLEKAVKASGNK